MKRKFCARKISMKYFSHSRNHQLYIDERDFQRKIISYIKQGQWHQQVVCYIEIIGNEEKKNWKNSFD